VTRVGSRSFVTQAAHRASRPVARSARTQSSRLARSTRGRLPARCRSTATRGPSGIVFGRPRCSGVS
jgi:hypothetical protein